MTLRIPSVDDRTYEQLADVLRRQLPTDEWTDHNAPDPGITVLELLAWLGEMTLYRMDRVPQSHRDRFLNFLIDPPEPVTVRIQFQAGFPAAPGTGSVSIPAGTLLATDFVTGRRFIFETFQTLTLSRPTAVAAAVQGSVRARAIFEVFNEALGVSDGSPNQVFRLRPPREALQIAHKDIPTPILTDFVHRSGSYDPNPRVSVDGVPWTTVPSLMADESRLTTNPPAQHCMIEPHEGLVRFGDDDFGAIPPPGAVVECRRYAVLDGPPRSPLPSTARHALLVKAGDVRHLLNFTPPAGLVTFAFQNSDAEGGDGFFQAGFRFEQGLRQFRAPYRLVTERDFERAVLQDFNEFQRLSASPPPAPRAPEILRASVEFDRRPLEPTGASEMVDDPSHVTFVLIASPPFDEDEFRDEGVAAATKQGRLAVPAALWQRIARFLDPRRLITTRLNRLVPELRELSITGTVVAARDQSVADLQERLRERVYGFLSLLTGDEGGRGWRLGRAVYRSQLYQLLEDTEGVDHVEALALAPGDAQGNVAIAPHQLPLLQALSITVVRS